MNLSREDKVKNFESYGEEIEFEDFEEVERFFNNRKNIYDLIFGEIVFSVRNKDFNKCTLDNRRTITRKGKRIDKGHIELTYIDIGGYKIITFQIENRKIFNILVGGNNCYESVFQ